MGTYAPKFTVSVTGDATSEAQDGPGHEVRNVSIRNQGTARTIQLTAYDTTAEAFVPLFAAVSIAQNATYRAEGIIIEDGQDFKVVVTGSDASAAAIDVQFD